MKKLITRFVRERSAGAGRSRRDVFRTHEFRVSRGHRRNMSTENVCAWCIAASLPPLPSPTISLSSFLPVVQNVYSVILNHPRSSLFDPPSIPLSCSYGTALQPGTPPVCATDAGGGAPWGWNM